MENSNSIIPYNDNSNIGWICPVCRTVYAPSVVVCHACKPMPYTSPWINPPDIYTDPPTPVTPPPDVPILPYPYKDPRDNPLRGTTFV